MPSPAALLLPAGTLPIAGYPATEPKTQRTDFGEIAACTPAKADCIGRRSTLVGLKILNLQKE